MQLQANTPQTSSLNFGSRFVRTKDLRKAFEEIKYENVQDQRQFVNALKAVLNDGQNDVIRLSSQQSEGRLHVNGKLYNKNKKHWINWSGSQEGIRNELIEFAEKEKGVARVFKFDSLSKDEANSIKDLVNELKSLKPTNKNFFSNINSIQSRMQSEIKYFLLDELERLQKEIFSIKKK